MKKKMKGFGRKTAGKEELKLDNKSGEKGGNVV